MQYKQILKHLPTTVMKVKCSEPSRVVTTTDLVRVLINIFVLTVGSLALSYLKKSFPKKIRLLQKTNTWSLSWQDLTVSQEK